MKTFDIDEYKVLKLKNFEDFELFMKENYPNIGLVSVDSDNKQYLNNTELRETIDETEEFEYREFEPSEEDLRYLDDNECNFFKSHEEFMDSLGLQSSGEDSIIEETKEFEAEDRYESPVPDDYWNDIFNHVESYNNKDSEYIESFNEFENAVDSIFEPLKELLVLKNHNYGSSFDKLREEYGPVSFLIRIKDKLCRYEALSRQELGCNDCDCGDERIEDTLKDIIGYVTLELIFRESLKK